MPKRLSYDDVSQYFKDNGCRLISKEYKNGKSLIEFECQCGHNRISRLDSVKAWKQFKCKECTLGKGNTNVFQKYNMGRKFKVLQSKMDKEFKRVQKYRPDFVPKKYDEYIKCAKCKRKKRRCFFSNNPRNTNGKYSWCKTCALENSTYRRENHSHIQVIKKLLNSAKGTSIKRCQRGRECVFDITVDDIERLLEEQDGRCVYTGEDFEWTLNHPYKISIDRIDSSKGYTPDNIQLVARIVNQAKSDMDDEDFLEMIRLMSAHLGL